MDVIRKSMVVSAIALATAYSTANAADLLSNAISLLKAAGTVASGVAESSQNQVAHQSAPVMRPRNVSMITDEQQAMIDAAVRPKGIKDHRVTAMLDEASDNLKGFLQLASCINDFNGSALNLYAAPGHEYSKYSFFGPNNSSKYHDKSTCVNVVRLQGVTAPAANALKFEVVYQAADSGEVQKFAGLMVKQTYGQWMFE